MCVCVCWKKEKSEVGLKELRLNNEILSKIKTYKTWIRENEENLESTRSRQS